jgi:hypothetical protein
VWAFSDRLTNGSIHVVGEATALFRRSTHNGLNFAFNFCICFSVKTVSSFIKIDLKLLNF